MILVYEYFDYRKLLKDLFDEQKEQNRYFSYRVLAESLDLLLLDFLQKFSRVQ